MSIHEPPTERTGAGLPWPDDLDGLLRAYFRTEMADPWPALQLPASFSATPPHPRRLPWGSRSALAASVALLLLSYLALSGSWEPLGPPSPVPTPVEVGFKPGAPYPHRPALDGHRVPRDLPPASLPIR
jgi:hypothetical protein